MNVRLHFLFTLLTASLIPQTGGAQELPTDVRQEIGKFLDATARKEISVGRIRIDSVSTILSIESLHASYLLFKVILSIHADCFSFTYDRYFNAPA